MGSPNPGVMNRFCNQEARLDHLSDQMELCLAEVTGWKQTPPSGHQVCREFFEKVCGFFFWEDGPGAKVAPKFLGWPCWGRMEKGGIRYTETLFGRRRKGSFLEMKMRGFRV